MSNMNCEISRQHMIDELTGHLPGDDSKDLHLHLESCQSCQNEYTLMQATWSNLAKLAQPDAEITGLLRLSNSLSSMPIRNDKGRLWRQIAVGAFILL